MPQPDQKVELLIDGQPVTASNPLPTAGAGGGGSGDGLTDAQLRATPVPVSGPLTDAELRDTPVPVEASGTVVTGSGAALNATPIASTEVANAVWVKFVVTGNLSGNFVLEGSIDNTNWSTIPWRIAASSANSMHGGTTWLVSSSGTGAFEAPVQGWRYVRLRLSSYASGTANAWASFLSAAPSEPGAQRVLLGQAGSGNYVTVAQPAGDGASHWAGMGLAVVSQPFLWNGSGQDRQRNNHSLAVLTSSARTTTTDSADQTNYNARGAHFIINVSAVTATPTVVFKIQGKDSISGVYYDILESVAITATGTTVLKVYPGIGQVANGAASDILPRTFRVRAEHANGDSITYSVSAQMVV